MRRETSAFVVCVLAAALAPASATFTQSAPQAGQSAIGAGLLAGRVVDGSGAPVPAVVVALRRGTSAPPAGRAAAATDRVMTDDAGRFVFSGLGTGRYEFDATKPGWLAGAFGRKRPGGTSVPLELADGERRSDLSISIWRAGAIGGRVTDDNGDPLVGVEVRAMRQAFVAGRPQSETPIRTKTDDLGAYRFSGLVPGSYLVAVLSSVLSEPPGFAGSLSGGGDRSYLQTMTAIGSLPMLFDRATAVTGPDKPLVSSLMPMLSTPAGDGAWLSYSTTFHPSSTTLKSASLVRLGTGESRGDVDITLRLAQTWQVSGTLRDAEGPAAGHAMHLIPAETPEMPLVDTATAVTDARGAFTFFGVPPGQYIVRVVRAPWPGAGFRFGRTGGTGQIPQILTIVESPNAGAPFSTEPLMHVNEPVSVGDRHVRNLALTMTAGPRVRGRIRFEGMTALPTPDQMRNVLIHVLPVSGRVDNTVFPGQVSADGQSFSSSSLMPGRYIVRPNAPSGWTFKDATWQGRNVSDAPLDLTADIDTVVITYVDRAHTISGNVQPEAGQPVAGSVVILFPPSPSAWVDYGLTSRRVATTTATASGAFSLPLPPEGEYLLVAIPDELSTDWRNPETLAKLVAIAERVRVADASITQSLQVKRFK